MMKTEEAGTIFEAMLTKAGFDPERPNIKIAWEIFKDFIKLNVDCADDTFFFECGAHDFTGQSIFYWDLVRQFEIEEAGEYDHTEQLHFEAQFNPDGELESLEKTIWSSDYETLNEFLRQLEEMKEFKAAIDRVPLKIEIYQEEI